MPEPEGMTAEDLRASVDQLHDVLEAIDSGTFVASARQRAFIAGALFTVTAASLSVADGSLLNSLDRGEQGWQSR